MRPQIVIILAFVIGLWPKAAMLAQNSGGSQNPPPPNSQRTPQLPIDDYVWIFLLIGLLYGCYMIYQRQYKSSTPA
ncbi:MAG: hypothetical protein HKM28_02230 [Flavobacteriaceae bacterium]|nr:hypothetical protein [Flavobacteriaceae bacterium]